MNDEAAGLAGQWQLRIEPGNPPALICVAPRPLHRDYLRISSDKRVTMGQVLAAVMEVTGITKTEILARRRTAHIVRARQVFFYVSRAQTTATLPAIGRYLGGFDHSTVLHGCRKVASNMYWYGETVNAVLALLDGRVVFK